MPEVAASVTRDQSPPLMMLGIIYALLFNAGPLAVSPLLATGSFPVPSSSAEQIVSFFRANGRQIAITSACNSDQQSRLVCSLRPLPTGYAFSASGRPE
jgi:hypothetical protein